MFYSSPSYHSSTHKISSNGLTQRQAIVSGISDKDYGERLVERFRKEVLEEEPLSPEEKKKSLICM